MTAPPRPIAFILASTDHGTMIVNRFDYAQPKEGGAFGVGHMLLSRSRYEPEELATVERLLDSRRRHFGDGVNVLDIGANIGVFTVAWARHMTGWGQVVAFEAQERIFHALCGNVAINNCFNARTIFAAVTKAPGSLRIPVPDYFSPASFGSLELKQRQVTEDIGQAVDYDAARGTTVPATSIDAMGFARVDAMKIDVEGMEPEVLEGALRTIEQHHPIMIVERIKTDERWLIGFLEQRGYRTFSSGLNTVGIHPSDPTSEIIRVRGR